MNWPRIICTVLSVMMLSASVGLADEQDASTEVPDMSDYMIRPYLTCEDVSFNCFEILPRFFFEDKPDSVLAMLAYWRNQCGPAEPILRTEILTRIWDDSFSEDIYDDLILEDLLWFQLKLTGESDVWSSHLWRWDEYAPSAAEVPETLADFDEFTADLADQILPYTDPGSLERLFCHFYRGEPDTLLLALQGDGHADTKLHSAYTKDLADLRKTTDLDIALTVGSWQPRGNLKTLGNHLGLGALVGISDHRWLVRVAAEMRLGGPSNFYAIRSDEQLIWTDRFLGLYVGLEGGMRLLRTRHHGVDLLLGAGYDGIEALSEDEASDGRWLNSLNLNAGAAYRYYFGPHSNTQIGLEARYEDTNFDTKGGSDLTGSAWNIRVVFGWSGDRWRNRRLSALRADRWGP